jgi:hypothetical protein
MMSKRRVLSVGGPLALAVFAFAGTTYAVGRNTNQPGPRANLAAAQLPAVAISASDQIEIKNSLEWAAERFGVSDASLSEVRKLADTEVGPVYLLFGSSGACLYMNHTSVCGDPGAPGQPLLALGTSHRGVAIGAGIAADSVHSVALTTPSRGSVDLPLINGSFVVHSNLEVPVSSTAAAHQIRFESK